MIYVLYIDPLGDIYKCWDEIGDISAKAGNIRSKITSNKNYLKWINYQFLTDKKCERCKVMPVCFGGCPYKYIKTGKRRCHPSKYNTNELVKLIYNLKVGIENNKLIKNNENRVIDSSLI